MKNSHHESCGKCHRHPCGCAKALTRRQVRGLLAEGREVRADIERRIRDMQREPAAFDGVKRGGGW